MQQKDKGCECAFHKALRVQRMIGANALASLIREEAAETGTIVETILARALERFSQEEIALEKQEI